MALLSAKQALNMKLNTVPLPFLRDLARIAQVNPAGSSAVLVKKLLGANISSEVVDRFIRELYLRERVITRRAIISDKDLQAELSKVEDFSWGVVQGQLDQKIQAEYVRRYVTLEQLLKVVRERLCDEVANYVICTWFNHWTTVLIEEHIAMHPRVVPTLKSVKGVDLFYLGQPFDLKVTYLPKGFDSELALQRPQDLGVWMYEHQGAQRFGADNRLYVVLFDRKDPAQSWKLKREFPLVFGRVDEFLAGEDVTQSDEIAFTFGNRTYTTVTKVLLITND